MPRTLRGRVALLYAAVAGATILLVCAVVFALVGRSLQQTMDAALAAEVSELAAFVGDYGEAALRSTAPPSVRFRFAAGYFEVTRASGETLMASEALSDTRLPAIPAAVLTRAGTETAFRTQRVGPLGRLRIAARRSAAPGLGVVTVQTAMPLHQTETTMRRLAPVLALCAVLACCVTLLAGWAMASWVVAPVRQVARTAQRISGEELGARVALERPEEEIRELTATFNDMLDRLQAAFEQARRFSADASHELRTPLAAIRGEVEVALGRDRAEAEYRELLRSVLEEVDGLSRLVGGLLDLSRADAGASPLSYELVELTDLAAAVCDRLEPRVVGVGGAVVRRWAPPVRAVVDPARFRQLLSNLLDNAAKYAASAGPVEVELRRAGEGVECRVSDCGPGLTPEHLAHVFDRFYRVDKARSRGMGGAGLGISICQWIAQAHGGSIRAESQPGVRTTFVFWLPAEPPDDAGEPRGATGG